LLAVWHGITIPQRVASTVPGIIDLTLPAPPTDYRMVTVQLKVPTRAGLPFGETPYVEHRDLNLRFQPFVVNDGGTWKVRIMSYERFSFMGVSVVVTEHL
jgi:hypothetical protein